jgi:beta-glucanase (GH16 family)
VPSSGKVVWEENFNSLDESTWRIEHSTYGDGNNELQCYRPENVSVRDGKLVLRAVTENYTCPNGETRRVTSGMIRSQGVTFSPGQAIEFRVKLNPADPDDQSGLWPAVWSSGWAGGGWPRGGELDYLEVMTAENPNRAMFSMHYADASGSHKLKNRGVIGDRYFSDDWHTIRFEYGRNGVLVWFLDGVEAFRVDDAPTLQGYPAPFDQSIGEIKVNLALGGRPGPLSDRAVGSQGASFEVDFIRILEI